MEFNSTPREVLLPCDSISTRLQTKPTVTLPSLDDLRMCPSSVMA